MSFRAKGRHDNVRIPAERVRQCLCHFLTMAASQFRQAFRAADFKNAPDLGETIIGSAAVFHHVEQS